MPYGYGASADFSPSNSGGGRESYGGGGQYSQPSASSQPSPPSQPSGNGGDRIQRIASGIEPGYTPTSSQPFGLSPEQAYREGKITVDQYQQAQQSQDVSQVEDQPNLIEKAFDLYSQYGLLPNALRLGGSLLESLGTASKSLQNKVIAFDLQNRLEKAYQDPTFDPFTPDASVTQLEQDLAKAKAGEFSQQEYQDRYAPQMNEMGITGGDAERAVQTALTPYAPYAITGTTPQDSMVQQYFSNLGMGGQSPLSSKLETDYNNAKQSINSLLGIIPPSQQFGYSSTPYGGLMGIDIDYLKQRGLM